jgi:hypothetical protein
MEIFGVPQTSVRPARRRCLVITAMSASLVGLTSGCSALLRSDDASFRSDDRDASSPSGSTEAGLPESGVVAIRECEHSAGARVAAKAPGVQSLFGSSMAADGDLLIAVAPFEANGLPGAEGVWRQPNCDNNLNTLEALGKGAVRVFDASTGFAEEALLPISGLSAVEAQLRSKILPGLPKFGTFPTYSVAVSNDVIAVGLGGDGAKAPFQGSVRLFRKDWVPIDDGRGNWKWLEAPTPIEGATSEMNDLFGMSVALSDGVLVVGAPSADVAAMDDGAAYVYDVTSNDVRLVTTLDSGTGIPSAYFGYTVAIDGDWLVVGAPDESPGNPNAIRGSVYLFHRRGLSFDRASQRLEMPGNRTIGAFGTSVALRGDTLAVGAPLSQGCSAEPADAFFPGSVYIYKLGRSGLWELRQCVDSRANYGTFGWSLAFRQNALLVGAPLETPAEGFVSSGMVYVFREPGEMPAAEPCFIPSPVPTLCGSFGLSLATGDSFYAVGSPYEGSDPQSETQPLDSGGAYIFRTNGTL